jgi:hypothetical protein
MNVVAEFISGWRAGIATRKYDQGKYHEAIPMLEKLVQVKDNRNNVYLHLCLGLSYVNVGETDKGGNCILLAYAQHKTKDIAVRYDLVEKHRRIVLRLMGHALARIHESAKAKEIEEELLNGLGHR